MKIPTCLRIVMIAMEIFYLLIGLVLFIGAVFLVSEFSASKEMLAPDAAENQNVYTIIGVAVVGVLMSIGSVFGGYGTMKNRDIWIVVSSSMLAPCFATLVALAACIMIYNEAFFGVMRATMQDEIDKNISNGLLKTGYVKFGCCFAADVDYCDRTYHPSLGALLFEKGCAELVWNGLFVPYINGAVSALFTISGILLAGLILGYFVYRSIVDETKTAKNNNNKDNNSKERQLPLANNRAIKQE